MLNKVHQTIFPTQDYAPLGPAHRELLAASERDARLTLRIVMRDTAGKTMRAGCGLLRAALRPVHPADPAAAVVDGRRVAAVRHLRGGFAAAATGRFPHIPSRPDTPAPDRPSDGLTAGIALPPRRCHPEEYRTMAERNDSGLKDGPAPAYLKRYIAQRRRAGRRRARRRLRDDRKSHRSMVASVAAHLHGQRYRGYDDRLIISPRDLALRRLAEYGDLIEDDVMQAMAPQQAAAYRHWPSTAPGEPDADTIRQLTQTLDDLGRHIAGDDDSESPSPPGIAAALVYPDGSVRMLPAVEQLIVSVAGASGTVAMRINADIGSPPYRDLTAPATECPLLAAAMRLPDARTAVIYALAGCRIKLRHIQFISGDDINIPVSSYLIAEGICARRDIILPPPARDGA